MTLQQQILYLLEWTPRRLLIPWLACSDYSGEGVYLRLEFILKKHLSPSKKYQLIWTILVSEMAKKYTHFELNNIMMQGNKFLLLI